METVKFQNYQCIVKKHHYVNSNRIALELIDYRTGEYVAMATVNVTDEHLNANEVIIKNWSENEGMYLALLNAKIIGPAIRKPQIGFIQGLVCPLLISLEVDIDLFEQPELLPQSVQNILNESSEDFDFSHNASIALLEKLKSLGYTFECFLNGQPYNLRKINAN